MRSVTAVVATITATAVLFAAPPLFKGASESKWTVSDGKSTIATVTVMSDGTKSRADWLASGKATTFVARDQKIWVKQSSGDIELSSHKGVEKNIVPALLLPTQTTGGDKVALSGANVASYTFSGGSAAYTSDAKGPQQITVTAGSKKYVLTRTSVGKSTATEASFAVTAKQGRLASLKQSAKGATGSLLASDNTDAAASASAKGMTPAEAAQVGIDLVAVESLMSSDSSKKAARATQLKKFQSEGKVGGAQ